MSKRSYRLNEKALLVLVASHIVDEADKIVEAGGSKLCISVSSDMGVELESKPEIASQIKFSFSVENIGELNDDMHNALLNFAMSIMIDYEVHDFIVEVTSDIDMPEE